MKNQAEEEAELAEAVEEIEAAEGESRSQQLLVLRLPVQQRQLLLMILLAGLVVRRGIGRLFALISPYYTQLHLKTELYSWPQLNISTPEKMTFQSSYSLYSSLPTLLYPILAITS